MTPEERYREQLIDFITKNCDRYKRSELEDKTEDVLRRMSVAIAGQNDIKAPEIINNLK